MAYRKCDEHGWLETAEYTVTPSGQTICAVCEVATHGYYADVQGRTSFGGPTHRPRDRFVKAVSEFHARLEEVESYQDEEPIMEDYELGE